LYHGVHPLLAWPYRAAVRAADFAAHLPLAGSSKVVRSLRARRAALALAQDWATAQRDPARPLVWFHAPSVGEGLQARPVIELLRTQRPDVQIAYTHFSPSAERFAESVGADFHGYLPFDTAANGRAMLAALKPSALVYSKLDVWPTLTSLAAASGVKVGMISATLAEGSGRRGALAAALLRNAYGALSLVGAIDADDADRLSALGVLAGRVRITGDTRYDQVAARAAARQSSSALLAPLKSHRPTLVAGSTWPADETVMFAAWRALRVAVPDARLLIAPHEPTDAHCAPIQRWASEAGLHFATLNDARSDHDVVIVDRVGVLGDLYALATVAYVGGGFHAAGLHSVLEPASFGVPVLFGPRHHMSRDARLLYEQRGGEPVRDVPEFVRALRILFTEEDTRARAGAGALAVVREGVGAAERSLGVVLELLDG
jgi:3-deoxy-D-manno-octulosonic-acid transferase